MTAPICISIARSPAMSFSFSDVLDSPPDTPQRRDVDLVAEVLVPVTQALTPCNVFIELRRRPVPAAGIRAGFLEPSDGVAVLKQHVQFVPAWHPPVPIAAGVEFRGVFLCLTKGAGRRHSGGRGKHGLAALGRAAGIDCAVRHYLPDRWSGFLIFAVLFSHNSSPSSVAYGPRRLAEGSRLWQQTSHVPIRRNISPCLYKRHLLDSGRTSVKSG